MYFSRRFEEEVKKFWELGLISAEMHMGIGEEAIYAGVLNHLIEGDAIALDHRGTGPMLIRGIDPAALLLEFLGHPQGICGGYGGHMHMFSKDHSIASSGIVGSSGPAAVGFALALQYKKTNNIAVAFLGEGSTNQGMMMESFNLSVVWNLPILFVCKSNKWAITTPSKDVTSAPLIARALGFGMDCAEVDGTDIVAVWEAAKEAIDYVRKESKPYFLLAHCEHKEGHFLGDPLLRFHKTPAEAFGQVLGPLTQSITRFRGAGIHKRTAGLTKILSLIAQAKDQTKDKHDPFLKARKQLEKDQEKLKLIELEVESNLQKVLKSVEEIMGRQMNE